MEYLSTQAILIFFLVLTRNTGMLMSAPIFGTGEMPPQIKIAMSFGLTIVMFPIIFAQTPSVPTDLFTFSLIAAKEIIIGILIGFAAVLIFTAIQLGGEYVSSLMGLSIANVVDPLTQQNVPVIGQFYFILALLIFLFINGHHWLIAAVQTSFAAIPIGFDFPEFKVVGEKLILLSSQMFVMALMLIVPILGVLFVTEVALGFMAKVMPHMNIFVVGLPLKIYVGLTLMLMVMPMSKIYIENMYKELSFFLYKLLI